VGNSRVVVALPPPMGSNVVSMRSVVVFPAPFGPRKPKISPRCTSMLTPRTASIGPPFEGKLFRSSVVKMTVSKVSRSSLGRVSSTITPLVYDNI
jgi:hypothetical protein